MIRQGMVDRSSTHEIAAGLKCSAATVNWLIRKTPELGAMRAEYDDARRRERSRKFTDEGLALLLRAGKTPAVCARSFGVDVSTIYSRIRGSDALQAVFDARARQREPRNREERDALVPRIELLMVAGCRRAAIEAELDLTPCQLTYILNENPEVFEGLRKNRHKKQQIS